MAERDSEAESRMALPWPHWRQAISIVRRVGRVFVGPLCVGVYRACLQLLSSTIATTVRQAGIPINKDVVDVMLYFLQLWILPEAVLQLLAWYFDYSLRNDPLATHGFRMSGIARYATDHVKDLAREGIFFSRNGGSTPRKHYAYSALLRESPSIRLLRYRGTSVFPLFESHDLEYHIAIFPLDRVPEYTAVSYTWGDPTRNKCITVQDGTTQCALDITTSAMECLMALKKRQRHIWIDSICINQSDVNEKMEQVGIMRDIYSRAAEVVAVLGNSAMATVSPTLSNIIPEVLRHSFEHHYSAAKSLLRMSILNSEESGKVTRENFEFYMRSVTEGASPLRSRLLRFLCHPYWTRVWIIQEIAIAKHVLVYFDGSLRELDSWFEAAETCRRMEHSLVGPGASLSHGKKIYRDSISKLRRPSTFSERASREELLRSYSRGSSTCSRFEPFGGAITSQRNRLIFKTLCSCQ